MAAHWLFIHSAAFAVWRRVVSPFGSRQGGETRKVHQTTRKCNMVPNPADLRSAAASAICNPRLQIQIGMTISVADSNCLFQRITHRACFRTAPNCIFVKFREGFVSGVAATTRRGNPSNRRWRGERLKHSGDSTDSIGVSRFRRVARFRVPARSAYAPASGNMMALSGST